MRLEYLLSGSFGDQLSILSLDRCTYGEHLPSLSHHDRLDGKRMSSTNPDKVHIEVDRAEDAVRRYNRHRRKGQRLIGERGDIAAEERPIDVQQVWVRLPALLYPANTPCVQSAKAQRLNDRGKGGNLPINKLIEPLSSPGS